MFANVSQRLADLHDQFVEFPRRNSNQIENLAELLNQSKQSFQLTRRSQEELIQQLDNVDRALTDLNEILRKNFHEKQNLQIESTTNEKTDIDQRAQLMLLNAEALECRAAAVQLQQKAKFIMTKTNEIEKRTNEQFRSKINETKNEEKKTIENNVETHRTQILPKEMKENPLKIVSKVIIDENEFDQWPKREFMNDDHCPQCIVRSSPTCLAQPIEISYVPVTETEHLLDLQEELIGTPLRIQFDAKFNDQPFIILAMPYITKRNTHHEHVIKIRQTNGLWTTVETVESNFEDHKEKRFVQCRIFDSTSCAVVSRLKLDRFLMEKTSSGQYVSTADHRFTIQWNENVVQKTFPMDARLHPVDLNVFTQFCRDFSNECQGLIAVGPIIELRYEDVPLLKPIHLTCPILVPPKRNIPTIKTNSTETSTNPTPDAIFRSMLAENENNERLLLLYTGSNENNIWHIDNEIRLNDSKTHDFISAKIQSLHTRMIVVRYDRNLMSLKQLPGTISLLDQMLQTRPVTFVIRVRQGNPNDICFTCFASERREMIENDLQKENYSTEAAQTKEMFLQEGQLLEVRFRGNVRPTEIQQEIFPMAFNTHFPFFLETKVNVVDRYAQHLSNDYYGFLQIFTKQIEKRKTSTDLVNVASPLLNADLCLIELVIRLPKIFHEIHSTTQKTLPTFTGEGVLTPSLFRDLSAHLSGDEWRRLARRLGMTRIRIEAIEHDYRDDAPYHMLLTWFKRVSRASDKVLILANALKLINRRDLAKDLQSIKEDKRYEQHTMSKEEQLRILSVAFNRIIQREECIRIWKQLARELSLTNENINQIEQDFSSRQERCLRCLEHWAFNEIRADVFCLAKVIRSLGFKTLARELEDMT